ncbi:hypothetical protein FZEAL_8659 [Fusarium zealandicum]|uniref:Uncharacterized protein n=1 Tax=Fusarium zealandicum TaxID=1053134 RepID=A0A8H4XHF9_9HYPO|nr:hypothetical protein FZEAL_8659 [Fusarium zealandicum]
MDDLASHFVKDDTDALERQANTIDDNVSKIERIDLANEDETSTASQSSPTSDKSGGSGVQQDDEGKGGGATQGGVGEGSKTADDSDASDKTDVIRFDDNKSFVPERVFSDTTANITYSTEEDVTFTDIKWQVSVNDKTLSLATVKFEDGESSIPDDMPITGATQGWVELALDGANVSDYYSQDMYILINWEREGSFGFTRSTWFSVSNSPNPDLSEDLATRSRQLTDDELEDSDSDPSSTADASASSEPTTGGEDSDGSTGGDGGGGGLSTGATAGIAVGAVIGGLVIIGAIAWFLLRRRRRNKQVADDYTSQQAYAVDKETHGRTADSPTSPYSDENQVQPVALDSINHDRGDPMARGTSPSGGVPRSSLGSHGRDGINGAETPQGMPSRVAHLVEDGMTPDEIRRLEEEERQLDDEIERAGRR